jgi:hypothetical protein
MVNPVKPNGNYKYHQNDIPKPYILPTECMYVFTVVHNKECLFPQTEM